MAAPASVMGSNSRCIRNRDCGSLQLPTPLPTWIKLLTLVLMSPCDTDSEAVGAIIHEIGAGTSIDHSRLYNSVADRLLSSPGIVAPRSHLCWNKSQDEYKAISGGFGLACPRMIKERKLKMKRGRTV